MIITSQSMAENASFNAFMNCYLREIDSGDWTHEKRIEYDISSKEQSRWYVDLCLNEVNMLLRLCVNYRSYVGRHSIDSVSIRYSKNEPWQEGDKLFVMVSIIQCVYREKEKISQLDDGGLAKLKDRQTELLARLFDSVQLMAKFIDIRKFDESLKDITFLAAEQSALYGHWLHPTPKSRQGITFWQQSEYSPELKAAFKLHYFSVDRSLISQGSVLTKTTEELIFDEVKHFLSVALEPNHVLIPQHPLQAHRLLQSDEVRALMTDGLIRSLGELGKKFKPTSSVRTLYCESSPWMYKFSIPVKITNSLRCNKKVELEDGMVVEQYLRRVGFLDFRPQFKVIDDPAYITMDLPSDRAKESGFEVVVRRNVVYENPKRSIITILTLVQDPVKISGDQLEPSLLNQIISRKASSENRSDFLVAQDWFEKYFECAIESLILLYDLHGFALEAHIQNSLLDLTEGYPSAYYYRDNQGYYLSNSYAETLREVRKSLTVTNIFYDDEQIFEAFAYYVFFNQLFAVMHRLGVDKLLTEEKSIEIVCRRLTKLKRQLSGIGLSFIDYILEQEFISCKTNLLARINDVDELQKGMEGTVYTKILNPLVNASARKNQSSYESGEQTVGMSHAI